MRAAFDRKIIIAMFIIFTACLLGSAVCIYRYESGSLRTLRGQLNSETTRLTDVKQKVDRMPELEAAYRQLESRLEFLEAPLPTAAYIPTFLAQIELLARETNNEIAVIRPRKVTKEKVTAAKGGQKINNETGEIVKEEPAAAGAKKKADKKDKPELPYDFIPIEMKVEGTYWTALQFLQRLQRFPKMIAVNSVGFTPRTSQLTMGTEDQCLAISLDLTAVVSKGASDGNAN